MLVVARMVSVAVLALPAAAFAQAVEAGPPVAPAGPAPAYPPVGTVPAPEGGAAGGATTPAEPQPGAPAPVYPPQPAPAYPMQGAPGYYPQPAPVYPPTGPAESPPAYPVQPAPVYPPQPEAYPAYPYPPPYGAPGYPGYSQYPQYPQYPQQQAAPVEVTSTAPPRGYHEHDGLFVHLLMGGGYASTKSDAGAKLSGAAITMSFDVGLAVARNLILHAGAGILGTPSPRVDSGGAQGANVLNSDQRVLDLYQFMVGATYYAPSNNLFASLRAGLGEYTLGNSNADRQFKSNLAWVLRGGFGKEWWIGPNWGIGAEAMVSYARVGSDRTDGLRALGGPMFGLGAVATYQ